MTTEVKRYIIICVGVMLIAPVICNFLIGLNKQNNVEVVGEAKDWLLFYSSYLGGIMSSICAFIVLGVTIVNSRKEQNITLRHSEIIDTVKDIASRVDTSIACDLIQLSNLENLHTSQEISRLQKVSLGEKILG